MDNSDKQQRVLDSFYRSLDRKTLDSLTDEQKQAVENAVLDITLVTRHKVDFRRSFPLFTRRYYLVLLFGRDFRRRPREESTLRRLLVSLLIVLALILGLGSLFITLYLIKSWLGIDIFQNYHLGLWDWLLNHRQSL